MGHLKFEKTYFFIGIFAMFVLIIAIFALIVEKVSSNSFETGYQSGNNDGFLKGNSSGFNRGEMYGDSLGFHRGDSIGFARGFDSKHADILKIEEVFKKLKYEFKPKIYYARIIDNVASVGSSDSDGNYQEFSTVMNSINTELLTFLSDNFELEKKDRNHILAMYRKESHKMNRSAYRRLAYLNKQTHLEKEKTIFSKRNIQGLNNFDSVLGNQICDVVSIFMKGNIVDQYSNFFLKAGAKEICPYVASYAIRPYLVKLKKEGIIKDYERSEIKIKQQVNNQIAEFATAEVTTSAEERFSYVRDMWLGTSRATVQTDSRATTKVGFDLLKRFELKIDHLSQEIIVQFPTPHITSHEVNTQFRDIDDGWFVKVGPDRLNAINYSLRKQLLNEAWDNTNVYYDAIANAEELLKVIFGPISSSMPYPYSVKVKFGNGRERILIDHSNLSMQKVLNASTFKG
ncbi:uncharacterized protein DUF4230 [Aquimarina sp. MAR_2010_214]|uniref:DUF4230 domain-containing protein n=1 Tax=Aquimarina sp. MAR_2010_214 TaxID=1250026 RepID=UPI000C6FE88C|nr:DUF4230 domain-containing protein [Aquimarina sp. MAR_2010_214]PKV50799.1 uncharacterized protein DUF4230 [Aquimarina sp. MAR_2010_214]